MNTRIGNWQTVLARLMALGLLGLLMGALGLGCSSQATNLKLSYSVEDQFERSKLYPGLRYYTSGTLQKPLGLVALDPDVTLDSSDWQPTEMNEKKLYEWVSALKLAPWVEYNQKPDGAVIADAQGKQVGYYYSVWKYPQVRFPAADRVAIDQPVAELRVTNRNTVDDRFGLGFD